MDEASVLVRSSPLFDAIRSDTIRVTIKCKKYQTIYSPFYSLSNPASMKRFFVVFVNIIEEKKNAADRAGSSP